MADTGFEILRTFRYFEVPQISAVLISHNGQLDIESFDPRLPKPDGTTLSEHDANSFEADVRSYLLSKASIELSPEQLDEIVEGGGKISWDTVNHHLEIEVNSPALGM